MTVCRQCGTENPDGFRFCGGCAAPLASTAVEERRERRVVSALMADLEGFTSRSERLDVEDVDAFLAPYRDGLRRVVEGTGGVVSDFAGDGMLAVFGAPVAHEDDAERAVRAAIAIRDSFLDPASSAPELHVRLGVTTGEVLVTLAGDQVRATGDVVNTAARLQAAAPTDGVLVDEWTYRATSRAILYQQAEPVEAKGKSEPVPAWRAVDSVSVLPGQHRDQLPLVGRDDEADLLRAALDRSRREPSTQLVSVIGEPGIGKTRLVEELYAYVDELPGLITWRRGRSLAYGEGVAFWALGEMVKGQAGILESDSAAVAQEKLSAAVARVIVDERDRGWVARQLRPLIGLEAAASGGDSRRAEAFAAWRRFVESLAEQRPTVLVFEDIHWADDALLDFIDLIAHRAGAVPLLIVCTARPELFQRRPDWSGGQPNATTISLTPLSDEDTARLVGGLLDQALPSADVQQPLLARAGGNPLYAQEYVRMLQDRGLLVREAGGLWALSGDVADLPESLHGIIAARLDTLSADEKSLLQDASVVGKTAWIGAVCALTDRSTWEAEELLHGLERKQLVQRVRRSSIEGETEFQFGHALTRDVAYGQIRRADRADKHEAAADWIEHLAAGREDKSELLADHYSQALSLREQLGDDTTRITPHARAALTEAGRQALALNAYTAAARHLTAALALTEETDPTRHQLLADHANAVFQAGEADEVLLQTACDAALRASDWEAAARLCALLADWYALYAERGEQADAVLKEGMEYATRLGYTPMASLIAYAEAYRLVVTGRSEEAIVFTEQAIGRAAAAGDDVGRALLRAWHGFARGTLGDPDGLTEVEDAVASLADGAHPKTPVVYNNLAELRVGFGDLPGAANAREQAGHWADRFGEAVTLGYTQVGQAETVYHAGDWDTAEEIARQLLDHPAQHVAVHGHFLRGRIMLARGDTALAREDAERTVTYAANTGTDEVMLMGLSLQARVAHDDGDTDLQTRACAGFLEIWAATRGMTHIAPSLAEITPILAQHEANAAAKLLPDASRWKRAILAAAIRDYDTASHAYEAIGSRPLAAHASLLAARYASNAGHEAPAANAAARALTFYETVGATHYARQSAEIARAAAG